MTTVRQLPPTSPAHPSPDQPDPIETNVVQLVDNPTSPAPALERLAEAADMQRAIAAGEIDAFVVSDGGAGRQVFTLSTADRPYRMFVENMRDGAATLSSNGLVLYANRRLADLLSCSRDAIVGSPLAFFVADDAAITASDLRGKDGLGANLEFALVDANGSAVPVLVGASPLEVEGDYVTCLTFTDLRPQKAQDREFTRLGEAQTERMADLKDAQAALNQQATHDRLTGLPNRSVLVDRIDRAIMLSMHVSRSTAVFFVDLDQFKRVNDTLGHAAGDAALRRVADQLVRILRPMDTVARIGGDEFGILVPNVDSEERAVDIGTRLLAELCRRTQTADEGEPMTASVGIAISTGGRGTGESLLHEADTAMYQAKSLGGGRAAVFDKAFGRQIHERSIARRTLQSALDDGRVLAYYQPIIDLATGTVTGFEALARIAESNGSVVLPAAFIPAAEENGLVVPLGARVLELACDEACGWHPANDREPRLTVAVNLSARQFEAGDLAALVQEGLERTGLPPTCLHLELTETAIMDLRPDILKQLGLITDLGVEIGLDDFGTGYASLTHLRRLPLSFVKIDRSFVEGLGANQGDERIVAAVADLAANLGLRSIAEGVETPEQLARLRELGCDQAQGYLFARPLPTHDVPAARNYTAW